MRLDVRNVKCEGRHHSLGLGDGLVDIGGEEQVSSSSLLDDIVELGLVDGEVVRVPSVNSGLVEIDNGDLDVGAVALAPAQRDQGELWSE